MFYIDTTNIFFASAIMFYFIGFMFLCFYFFMFFYL